MIIASLLLGFALGLAFYWGVITLTINHFPETMCDYCEFRREVKKHKGV